MPFNSPTIYFKHSPKKKKLPYREFMLPSLSTYLHLTWLGGEIIWINFWLFLFSMKTFSNNELLKEVWKLFYFHQLQAVFIAFQCTKVRNFSSHFRTQLLFAVIHAMSEVGCFFFGFPVCKWKRVLIVAFVLKMKSLFGISHKRLFNMMGWRRCMRLRRLFSWNMFWKSRFDQSGGL